MSVFPDLSAVFATVVSHVVLLKHLSGMGMGCTILEWFHSFLLDRPQKVVQDTHLAYDSFSVHFLSSAFEHPHEIEVIRRFGLQCYQPTHDT